MRQEVEHNMRISRIKHTMTYGKYVCKLPDKCRQCNVQFKNGDKILSKGSGGGNRNNQKMVYIMRQEVEHNMRMKKIIPYGSPGRCKLPDHCRQCSKKFQKNEKILSKISNGHGEPKRYCLPCAKRLHII